MVRQSAEGFTPEKEIQWAIVTSNAGNRKNRSNRRSLVRRFVYSDYTASWRRADA